MFSKVVLSFPAPYPPRNISVRIVHANVNENWEEQSGDFPEESFLGTQNAMGQEKVPHILEDLPELPTSNTSNTWPDYHYNSSDYETTSQPDWWINETDPSESEDEFVNVVPKDYEDIRPTVEFGTPTPPVPPFFPVQMMLSWLPPKPPTAFDGFYIRIEREGNVTRSADQSWEQETGSGKDWDHEDIAVCNAWLSVFSSLSLDAHLRCNESCHRCCEMSKWRLRSIYAW